MKKHAILVIPFLLSGLACGAQQPTNTIYKAPVLSASAKAEIEKATRAIASAPTADNYCARGRIYGRNKHFTQAIQDITNAIQLDPKKAFYWFARGAAYADLGKWLKGIDDATKAISLSKKGDSIYINSLKLRGHCYYESGQQKLADADDAALRALGDMP